MDGNLEKVDNFSIKRKPAQNFNTELSQVRDVGYLSHHWRGEESKQQSPRSLVST